MNEIEQESSWRNVTDQDRRESDLNIELDAFWWCKVKNWIIPMMHFEFNPKFISKFISKLDLEIKKEIPNINVFYCHTMSIQKILGWRCF